jgi:hypothetical protein
MRGTSPCAAHGHAAPCKDYSGLGRTCNPLREIAMLQSPESQNHSSEIALAPES